MGPARRFQARRRCCGPGGIGSSFYSNEREEPAHIHVEQAERHAKFWLASATLAESAGFRSGELAGLRRLVFQHRLLFQEAWDGHFGGQA